jgi:hypothetical protein
LNTNSISPLSSSLRNSSDQSFVESILPYRSETGVNLFAPPPLPVELSPIPHAPIQREKLVEHIFVETIQSVKAEDPFSSYRKTAAAICFIIAAGAQAFFYPLLKENAKPYIVVGNCLSFMLFHYDSIRSFIHKYRPETDAESQLSYKSSLKGPLKVFLTVSGLVIPAAAQSATAFALKDIDTFSPWIAVPVVWLGGTLLWGRSLQLLALKVSSLVRLYSSANFRELEMSKQLVCERLQEYEEGFIAEAPLSEKVLMDRLVFGLLELPRANHPEIGFLNLVIDHSRSVPGNLFSTKVATVVGSILGGVLHSALTMWTKARAEELFNDSKVIPLGISACYFFSAGYLPIAAIIQKTRSIAQFLCGSRKRTVGDRLRPWLSYTLKLLGSVLNLSVYCSSLAFFSKYSSDDDVTNKVLVAFSFAAFFLEVNQATFRAVERVSRYWVHLKGTDHEKDVLEIMNAVKKLRKTLEGCSYEDWLEFVVHLPPNMQELIAQYCTGGTFYLDAAVDQVYRRMGEQSQVEGI